ncbi:MAG: M28 family peptidase [Verrucomicrobiota bacterium]
MSSPFLKQLQIDTEALALPEGRRVGQPGHAIAQAYLEDRLRTLGVIPFSGESHALPFSCGGQSFVNLVGCIPGEERTSELKPILIGAHYDSVIDAPCADDNATSVAATLGLAECCLREPLRRDVIVAFFDSEEPPYFHTEAMGSTRFYEDYCKKKTDFSLVLISDLIGHDVEIPHPSAALFPALRSLVAVLGSESSPQYPDIVRQAVGRASGLRVIPTLNRYVGDMSDHHAFRLGGQPFLFLSCAEGKHYHQPSDTIEWINFRKLERITRFMEDLMRQVDAEDEIVSALHDPWEFEAEMIENAFSPTWPLLRRSLSIPSLESRRDIDEFLRVFLGALGR